MWRSSAIGTSGAHRHRRLLRARRARQVTAAPPSSDMNSRRLVCRERSIVRGDRGRVVIAQPPSRLEARRRLGCQTANELGAPVAPSMPEQLPGHEPHQQGWDTKMAMFSFCGIDVSKDRLDVGVLPEGWFFSVSNDTAGWAELVARLRPLTVSAIGLEPSGGYERG